MFYCKHDYHKGKCLKQEHCEICRKNDKNYELKVMILQRDLLLNKNKYLKRKAEKNIKK